MCKKYHQDNSELHFVQSLRLDLDPFVSVAYLVVDSMCQVSLHSEDLRTNSSGIPEIDLDNGRMKVMDGWSWSLQQSVSDPFPFVVLYAKCLENDSSFGKYKLFFCNFASRICVQRDPKMREIPLVWKVSSQRM